MTRRAAPLRILAVKVFAIAANVASLLSFALYLIDRFSAWPSAPRGIAGLNVILHLGILTALAYGLAWSLIEKVFGWDYGGGGKAIPSGWSAVALSASLTVPLVVLPAIYERATGIVVLRPMHWRGAILVVLLGATAHILIFGTDSVVRNGLRDRITPPGQYTFPTALLREFVFAFTLFGLIAFPYRLIVDPDGALIDTILSSTVLPAAALFTGMAVFAALKYPGSEGDARWIEVRGVVAGLLVSLLLSAGMFF